VISLIENSHVLYVGQVYLSLRQNAENPISFVICAVCKFLCVERKGISRLSEMVKSGILISSKEQSAMHGINLLNRLESLKLQKQDLEMKTGIIGILFPDENVQNAISLVDAEIKKIEGELANLAHKKEKK
jgi:hypothetical protein